MIRNGINHLTRGFKVLTRRKICRQPFAISFVFLFLKIFAKISISLCGLLNTKLNTNVMLEVNEYNVDTDACGVESN